MRNALNKASGLAIAIAAAALLGSGSAHAQGADVRIDETGCRVFDAGGVNLFDINIPFLGGDAVVQAVMTPSGNSKITCAGTLPDIAVLPGEEDPATMKTLPNRAVIKTNFLCTTTFLDMAGKILLTEDSFQVVTKSGRVKLTCFIHEQ